MTTVAVLADPPHPESVFSELVASSPLSKSRAFDLYVALLWDTVLAVEKSGGDLLINYRPADAVGLDVDSESAIRSALGDGFDLEGVRFEPQVGETFAGRAGNTATHLLEREAVGSVGIVRPEAALFARTDIDSAAMKLRSSPVVIGPAPGGRIAYATFSEPIDYADCYSPPALETLTTRALEADLDVEYLETKPFLRTAADLAEIILEVRIRLSAGALVPPALAEWVKECELPIDADGDGVTLGR